MHRYVVAVPVLAALIATVLLLVQGGFGAGHGDLDRAIWILGLPGILSAEWAPTPMHSHDLLLLVWWPALWNALLWAAIGKGLSRLRTTGNEVRRSRHAIRTASAYLHPDGFILHAQHRAASGVLLSALPVVRLPLDASAEQLGITLRQVLDAYKEGVPHPTNWSESAATFLKSTGYRSWRALESPARSCWIAAAPEGFQFTPLRNGGSRGEGRGFRPFDAQAILAPADATDEQLGDALKAALDASPDDKPGPSNSTSPASSLTHPLGKLDVAIIEFDPPPGQTRRRHLRV